MIELMPIHTSLETRSFWSYLKACLGAYFDTKQTYTIKEVGKNMLLK